jgi:hypothetical protein
MRCIGIFNDRVPRWYEDHDQCNMTPFPHFIGSEYREMRDLPPTYKVAKLAPMILNISENTVPPTTLRSSARTFNLVRTAIDELDQIAYGMYLEEK